jgi:hypothetical protein
MVMSDLESMAVVGRNVYFAVDAMSPRYIRTLAEAMSKVPEPMRWSAELRLERTFPRRDIGELLGKAGCVAVSFGYESGSQRILDAIDKGVAVQTVRGILQGLVDHGVAAQMMGFTGFPSEQESEARETYEFLIRNGDVWSLACIGDFTLTPGSIVAKEPDRFGIEMVSLPAEYDVRRYLAWRNVEDGTTHWPGDPVRRISPSLVGGIRRCLDNRPFVGGIDSFHSLLYFGRYGTDLFPKTSSEVPVDQPVEVNTTEVPFDSVDDFTNMGDLESAHASLHRTADGVSYRRMADWLREPGKSVKGKSAVAILRSGLAVSLPPSEAGASRETLNKILRMLSELSGAV